MYIHDGNVDVVEQFRVKLDRVAGGEEHHDLLTLVLLEECEQQQKTLLRGTHYIPLYMFGWRGVGWRKEGGEGRGEHICERQLLSAVSTLQEELSVSSPSN